MTTWIFTILLVVITTRTEGESKPSFYQTSSIPYEQQRRVSQNPQVFLDGSTLAKLFQGNYNFYENLNQLKSETFNDENTARIEEFGGLNGDYRKFHSVNYVSSDPLEPIESDRYDRKVPEFDTSYFDQGHEHQSENSNAEVHYHQHKHIHKHDHKQDHAHVHKNQHQHKHSHHQQHKHDHHSDHKHGHDHKHDHHQNHKHDHHHKHKHGHQEKHKHDHHHGHKHEHQTHSHHSHYDHKF